MPGVSNNERGETDCVNRVVTKRGGAGLADWACGGLEGGVGISKAVAQLPFDELRAGQS